jgi:ribonuclease HI
MSAETARLGYRTVVCPRLEFPLAVTHFTQVQCDKIMSPVLNACLSKMGYNRCMPREVVYGPQELGGIAAHDYYIEQGIAQIGALVGHLRQNSDTGDMMRCEMAWCQLQAGVDEEILLSPATDIGYIESCWITSIRDFMHTFEMRIDLTKAPRQRVQCEHDVFLMDAFRRSGHTAGEMSKLNACRMYLRVVRLSDIVYGDGKHIIKEATTGDDRFEHYYRSTDKWPRQSRPPTQWWKVWRTALQKAFSKDGKGYKLRYPLGAWNSHSQPEEWTCVAVTSPDIKVFKRCQDGRYKVLKRHTASRRNRTHVVHEVFENAEYVDTLPRDAIPVTLSPRRRSKRINLVSMRTIDLQDETPEVPTTFREFVMQTGKNSPHIASMLRHCDMSEKTALRVADLIKEHGFVECASDGGASKMGKGTFGFVVANHSLQEIIAKGKGRTPGRTKASSTRAELSGILAVLMYVLMIRKYYKLFSTRLHIEIWCDSKAAIDRTRSISTDMKEARFGTTWRCRQDYDLEAAIRRTMRKLAGSTRTSTTRNTTFNIYWVEGHAERRRSSPDEYTWQEDMNVAADEQATLAEKTIKAVDDSHWPEQEISVIGKYGRFMGRLNHDLRRYCTADQLRSYYCERYNWRMPFYNEVVDESGIKKAIGKLSGGQLRRVQKLRCGWLPVNRRMARTDVDCLDHCVACKSPTEEHEETVDHLFQCRCAPRQAAINSALKDLKSKWAKWSTVNAIGDAILLGARAWLAGEPIPDIEVLNLRKDSIGQLIRQAYAEQTSMGWNVLFRGFWSSTWSKAQDRHYDDRRYADNNKMSGDIWLGRTISYFFESVFEPIWELRNKSNAGEDSIDKIRIRSFKVDRTIRRLWKECLPLPYEDRRVVCFSTLSEVLTMTLYERETWINATTSFLPKARARLRARGNDQRSITEFFPRIQSRLHTGATG